MIGFFVIQKYFFHQTILSIAHVFSLPDPPGGEINAKNCFLLNNGSHEPMPAELQGCVTDRILPPPQRHVDVTIIFAHQSKDTVVAHK